MQVGFQVFREAAKGVARGWAQYEWSDNNGNICPLQAVLNALGISDALQVPWEALVEMDTTLIGLGTYCSTPEQQRLRDEIIFYRNIEALEELIWGWNDEEGRTQAEAIEMLERTADRLEPAHHKWLRGLMERAIRPSSWRYAGYEDYAMTAD